MKEIKMELPADYNFVPGIRNCLTHFAYNFGFNDREAYHIQTIVDEICNNAIEHGSKGKNAKIFITCR
ncbi:MAG: ATP-binding protein, partial [Candidatus Omnitrophica bacterium]|nr:ATP-binding protein [Candidatus Omnitrophota bacterium]